MFNVGARPSSIVSNQSDDLGRLYKRPNSNGRLSSEYNIRAHSLLRSSSSQDDFSDEAISASRNNSVTTLKHEEFAEPLAQRTSSLHIPEIMPKVISKSRSPLSPTPGHTSSFAYSQVTSRAVQSSDVPTISPRQVGRSIPRPRQHVSGEDEEWDSRGTTISRPVKERTSTESIDLNEIQGKYSRSYFRYSYLV